MLTGKNKTLALLLGGAVFGALIASGIFMGKIQNLQAAQSAVGNQGSKALFSVDGVTYSSDNLPADGPMNNYVLEDRIYKARQAFSTESALRIALAKDAGIELSKATTLPQLQDLLHIAPLSEAEAKAYYDQLLAKVGKQVFGGQSFDAIKQQLMAQMQNQQMGQAVHAKLAELTKSGRVSLLLVQPQAPAVPLAVDGYPVRGQFQSSTVFVEIGDYLCPHCREANAIVDKLYGEVGAKVRFVYIPFSLAPKGLSGTLTKGAYCAQDQGSGAYWRYHEKAFQVPWEKMEGNPDTFSGVAMHVATDAGLNTEAFKTCLTSQKAQDFVDKTVSTFSKMPGFEGTPAFFVNGRMLDVDPSTLDAALRARLTQ